MKKALVGIVAILFSVSAVADFKDDPYESFWVDKINRDEMTIKWVRVDNPTERCLSEANSRWFVKLPKNVQACSFWKGNQCVIITNKYTTMHQLGHETRHCFQGNFH